MANNNPPSRKSELMADRGYLKDIWHWAAAGRYVSLMICMIIGFGSQDIRAQTRSVKSEQIKALKAQFSQSLPQGLAEGVKVKRWSNRRKIVVLKTMMALGKRAPGLIVRANHYRPVKFYYLAGRHRATARASVMGNSIEFTDAFFKKGPKGRLAILAHEISHLADSGYMISGSAVFTDLITPHIAKARKAHMRAKLTWYEAVSRGRHGHARKAGLPGAYGAFNQEEALAEGLGRYLAGWYKPPLKLKMYFEGLINDEPVASNPALVAWHRAQDLLAAGVRSAELKSALREALDHHSGFTAAHLVRLKLNALRQQEEDLTQAVDLGLASAYAPFLKSGFHETAALAFLIKGKAAKALDHANQAITYVPASALLYLLRARIHLALENPKSALSDYKTARRLGRFHFTKRDRSMRRQARRMLRQQKLVERK